MNYSNTITSRHLAFPFLPCLLRYLHLSNAMKDQALLEKHAEIERLQTLMPEEHSDFWEILGHEIGLLKSEDGQLVKLAQLLVLER